MTDPETHKIHQFLHDIQLDQFYRCIVDDLHVTRLNHFAHVTDQDLDELGMSKPAQRRLFEALKKSKKRPLFGSFRKKKSKTKLFSSEPDDEESPQSSLLIKVKPSSPGTHPKASSPSRLTCVIEEKDLVLHQMLGTGAFGYVRKAQWKKSKNKMVDVAVKCLKISKDSAFIQLHLDFAKEANGMILLDHPHIIKLYGVVLSTPLMLVTELAPLGCLLTCLRAESQTFLISELCDFVIQVASGMAYLEAQHYIHRDLAARNLLLSSRDMVKIGDFGLMRPLGTEEDYYTMNPKGKVPFAWCPPESLKFRKFSHASDVWSFGILLMELFSYGEEPWPGLNCTQILQKVDMPNLERPQKPSHCPSKIYNVVYKHCWAHDPTHRPTFAAIHNIMEQIRPQDVKAKHTFDSKTPQNVCFIEGDGVTLIESSPDASWWRGQNKRTGRVGMFPCDMVDGHPGVSNTSIIRGSSFTRSVPCPKSPVSSSPGNQSCDCGEKHMYEFPLLVSSPQATSPTQSVDSELTLSTESGYSSSFSSRTGSACSRSPATYENCIGVPNYELMEPSVKTKPTKSAPLPYEEHTNLTSHSAGAVPNTPSELKGARSPRQGSHPKRYKSRATTEPLPDLMPRQDTATKRLSSSDIPTLQPKLEIESSCHETITTSLLSDISRPVTEPGPNSSTVVETVSKRLSSGATPETEDLKPNLRQSERVPRRSSSTERRRTSGPFTLSRRVSAKKLKSFDIPLKRSDGTTSPPLPSTTNSNSSSQRSCSLSRASNDSSPQCSPVSRPRSEACHDSPEERASRSFARSCCSDHEVPQTRSCRERQKQALSQTELSSPSDVGNKGRSYSFASSTQRGRERAEMYENHDYIVRSNSMSVAYDNHRLRKSVIPGPFYENQEIVDSYNQTLASSPQRDDGKSLECNMFDCHGLRRESQNSVAPQGYEEMSFLQTSNDKNPKVYYENVPAESIRSSQNYENFVMVEHSDVPDEIGTTVTNLKCPSYENKGFNELKAQSEKDLDIFNDPFEKDIGEYSCSMPNSGHWEIFKEGLDSKGMKVIKMGRSITPRIRRTSSDSDLRHDDEQSHKSDSSSKLKEKTQEGKLSVDITGALANALSNRMNVKEHVTIANNKVKLIKHHSEIYPENYEEHITLSLQDREISDKMNDCSSDVDDIPPPLPERKWQSLPRPGKVARTNISYENVRSSEGISPIPVAASKQDMNSLEDNTSDENGTWPTRPNVLSFQNKLAAFTGDCAQATADQGAVFEQDDAPVLPPKEKLTLRSPIRSMPSNYPRLSRDSSDVKLSLADDVQRYRPCPTKGNPNYEYPRMNAARSDDTPPPLPEKNSRRSPDVPPRTDLTCN